VLLIKHICKYVPANIVNHLVGHRDLCLKSCLEKRTADELQVFSTPLFLTITASQKELEQTRGRFL